MILYTHLHTHKHTDKCKYNNTQTHTHTQLGEEHPSHAPAKWGSLLCEPPAAPRSARSTHHPRGSDTEWDVLDLCPCTPLGSVSLQRRVGGGRIIHSLYLQQYGGGTSITFPGWTTVFFRPKKKDPLWHYVESAFWKWKELALYYEKGGRVFLPQRCGCQEPKPTGSLQSNTLLLYKTSSRRSKKIMYKAMFLLTKIQQKIYTPEK